jgi:hypothetical membrane protein
MNEFFRSILTGNIPKTKFAKIFIPILLGQIICWTIARALVPGGYYIDVNVISRQGNVVRNPIGSGFFIVSTAITGFLLVFYFIYLYRRLLPTARPVCIIFAIFGILGGIGLALVGLFPEETGETSHIVHLTGNIMAFVGLGLATFFSFLIMLRRVNQKRPWPTLWQLGIVFALCLQFILILPFTDGSSVLQWNGYNIIFVWICGMFLISPENPEVASKPIENGQ